MTATTGSVPDYFSELQIAESLINENGHAQRPREYNLASNSNSASPASRIITASDLVSKEFEEPKYAVPGVVPDGACVLVGAPKRGKSWLLLGLGIEIASPDGRALGKIRVEHGDALLLCLEDSQRRLQERLCRILDGGDAPDRLHLVTEWPRLDEGGAEALDTWLKDHPDTRLVGIDVLARLRPPSRDRGDLYQRDYETGAAFKRVADAHGVALIVVHHSRKAAAEDPLDLVSGTAGLAGAMDTALILTRERGRADANLYVRGRDVPEADYALTFDNISCRWSLAGDAAEYRLSASRADVLKLLGDYGPAGPKEIAAALGPTTNRGSIRVLLQRMKNAGQVAVQDGIYSLPVTGATPQEIRTTTPKSLVTPIAPVTGGVTGKTHEASPNSHPVTPVTPQVKHLNGAAVEGDPWAKAMRVSI